MNMDDSVVIVERRGRRGGRRYRGTNGDGKLQ